MLKSIKKTIKNTIEKHEKETMQRIQNQAESEFRKNLESKLGEKRK